MTLRRADTFPLWICLFSVFFLFRWAPSDLKGVRRGASRPGTSFMSIISSLLNRHGDGRSRHLPYHLTGAAGGGWMSCFSGSLLSKHGRRRKNAPCCLPSLRSQLDTSRTVRKRIEGQEVMTNCREVIQDRQPVLSLTKVHKVMSDWIKEKEKKTDASTLTQTLLKSLAHFHLKGLQLVQKRRLFQARRRSHAERKQQKVSSSHHKNKKSNLSNCFWIGWLSPATGSGVVGGAKETGKESREGQ